jgi:hypothetical protein
MQKRSCEERIRVLARGGWAVLGAFVLTGALQPQPAAAQMSTTTVQGTIYRADGTAASGTVLISWPAFSTAANQAVAAGSLSATIGANGFLSVNLTPNAGATPAGSYYTAVYHLSDGTVNREYWVVPASGTASVASVRALLEPSTVAVQPSVTEAYVQSAIASISSNFLPLTGGTLTGPLTLSGDPVAADQPATKHYADAQAAAELPLSGGTLTGPVTAPQVNGVYVVDGAIYGTVQAAAAACLASTNAACVIDARGDANPAAHAIGSFDPNRTPGSVAGVVPVTLELGPYSDYTGNITLETGMKILGNGGATAITSASATQPALTIPTCAQCTVKQVSVEHVTFVGWAGNTSEPGLVADCGGDQTATGGAIADGSAPSGNGLQYSEFLDVTFRGYEGIGVQLSCNSAGNSSIMYDKFIGVQVFRSDPVAGAASPLLYIGGAVGNDIFVGGNFDCMMSTGGAGSCNGVGTNVYIGVYGGSAGGTGPMGGASQQPYSISFYGTAVQYGGTLMQFNGAGYINLDNMHHEGIAGATNGYLFTLGGSQNKSIKVDGALFTGNIGYGAGGYIFNTANSGTGLTLNVTNTTWGNPVNVVIGETSNASQTLLFSNNYPNVSGNAGANSGVIAQLTAAATLNTHAATYANVSGTTPICALSGYQMPGDAVTLRATASGVVLESGAGGCSGGNLNLNGLASLTLNTGETASFTWNDGTSTWDLNAQGKSANRILTGTTTVSDTGLTADNQFQNFVSAAYGNCWVSRSYAGSPGLWSPSMTCTSGTPANLAFYGSPQAAKGAETWSLLASLQAGLASLPGSLGVAGGAEVQGAMTGASINGEITVDGTTYPNLNAAWNAAANEANASGQNQTIRLGPGTFPVTATLAEPSSGACVSVTGSAGTTMNADSPQIATTLTVPRSLGGDVFFLGNAAQAQGCTFRDLNLMAGSNATHGFEMQWFRGLLLDNVTVNDTTAVGILLGEENPASGHQASFLLRNVTVSYASGAFTPANRAAYGIHLQQTAMDSHLDTVVVRNALTAAVWNEGTGNTGYLIHGFGYPYTCTTAPCANNAASGSAGNASYATSYVIYDTGGAGSVWTDTYADSPAIAGFYIGANGVAIHGGHIQWPELTSFPGANLAYVAAGVSNNLLIADVDCLEMNAGVNWITYAGPSGNPPTFSSVHHLTGCGNYYQALEPAVTTGFSSGGANINDPSGAVPRIWATPLSAAANEAAYAAQMYTGYQGDAFQAHFSGVSPFFNLTYQGTIRTTGGIALGTIVNTAAALTLTAANKNVIANAASGPQTITLPSCYTPLADNAAPTGLEFTIVKSDTSSNAVTLAATSSELIYSEGVGAATLVLPSAATQTLVCGPDYNWYVAGSSVAAAPSGVTSFNGRTGAVVPQSSDYSGSYDALGAGASAQNNAETFSANAGNITSGKLPHAQLPALQSADIPNNAASTTGNAATATALAATPSQCPTGYYSTGITGNGTANCLQSWHFTWYGTFAGTFGASTNVSLGAIWTPTASLTMTRLDIAVGTAPAGCSTYPVIGIYDGTSSTWLKTVTLASGTYSYRNAVSSVSITAGHNLSMGVQTAGVGCTTNPGTAQITMEYTMNQ